MESEAKAETTEQAEQRGFGDWSENNRGFVCVNDAVGPNRESSGKWAEVIVGWILAVAVFSFLYFLKIKISKIYVRFEIFQNYPRSPPIGRQALSVIFFLQIRNEVPGKKKPCRPLGATGPFYKP